MIDHPVARLFWEMDPDQLDLARHRRAIIRRVLNYGTLADWRWLEQNYGRAGVRAEAVGRGRNGVRERSGRLAALLFA